MCAAPSMFQHSDISSTVVLASQPPQPRKLARFPSPPQKIPEIPKMGSWSTQDIQNHHLHRLLHDNTASSLSLQLQPVVGALRQNHRDHLGHHSVSPSLSPSPSASSIRILSTASSAPPRAHPMPPKRTASGSPTGTPAKLPKQETKPETFSNSVKKRLQSSTRTGQACDRCKVRRRHPL